MAMSAITRWHTDHNRDVCWPESWSVDESDCNDGNDGEWIGGIIIPRAIWQQRPLPPSTATVSIGSIQKCFKIRFRSFCYELIIKGYDLLSRRSKLCVVPKTWICLNIGYPLSQSQLETWIALNGRFSSKPWTWLPEGLPDTLRHWGCTDESCQVPGCLLHPQSSHNSKLLANKIKIYSKDI